MNTPDRSFYIVRPDILLRLEGLMALAAACNAYGHFYAGRWGLFALLFLAPDISLLGYLRSKGRASAAFYNTVHSYVLPLVLGLISWRYGWALGGALALIWLSHIALDRMIGYGLKFPGDFRRTHIQASASP